MTITGRSPEHDLKATNDGDISNPPAHDPHSTGGINAPRSSHKTASRPSCPATDEHIVLHDGARIMTMPAIRSNPLIPSTSVSSHHGTQTHTVQTSQFHDSECKDADHDQRYSTYWELKYAYDKDKRIIPIKRCADWPPKPPLDHDGREEGIIQNTIVFKNGLAYLDWSNKKWNPAECAKEVKEALQKRSK